VVSVLKLNHWLLANVNSGQGLAFQGRIRRLDQPHLVDLGKDLLLRLRAAVAL